MKPSGSLDEELLHKLLMEFPEGKIFNLRQGIVAAQPILATESMTMELFSVFPDVSSLIFLPLLKCDKTKWLAAMIVWTCEPSSTFKEDDLYYLKAAGNMVVLEITQADHSALEKSNFDPLSLMNHELRSPLHGVLANAELLQSTDLDPAQRDMVTTLETCGEMLLDSLNYLWVPYRSFNLITAQSILIASRGGINNLIEAPKSPTRSQPISIPDTFVCPMSVMPSWDDSLSKISNTPDGRSSQPVARARLCDDEPLSPKGQRSSGTLHVLIVDDNNINLKVHM
jgi:hypothetical protein